MTWNEYTNTWNKKPEDKSIWNKQPGITITEVTGFIDGKKIRTVYPIKKRGGGLEKDCLNGSCPVDTEW